MLRRNLLTGTAASFVVAGCTLTPSSLTVSTITGDAQLVLAGVSDVASEVGAFLPVNTMATVTKVVADAQAVLAAIAASPPTVSLSTAQGWVTTLMSGFNTVVAAVNALKGTGVAIPTSAAGYLADVEAILPILATAAQIALTFAASAPGTLPSPAQARTNLLPLLVTRKV